MNILMLYPFYYWWTFGLLTVGGYCKQCCYEHSGIYKHMFIWRNHLCPILCSHSFLINQAPIHVWLCCVLLPCSSVLVSVAYSLNYWALYYKILKSSRTILPTLLFSQNILDLLSLLYFHIHFRFYFAFSTKPIEIFIGIPLNLCFNLGKIGCLQYWVFWAIDRIIFSPFILLIFILVNIILFSLEVLYSFLLYLYLHF